MEERKLNFTRNDDQTPVKITSELKKKAKKAYDTMNLNLHFMMEQLGKNELNEGMKETHLGLIEHYTSDFCDLFGYESIQKKAIKERHAEVRGLNEENRSLRKQLGEKITNEDLRERVKNIEAKFNFWWNSEGFGHCRDINITGYGGLVVELSGMITEDYRSRRGKLDTEEKKIDHLRKLGFECADDDGRFVIANDANIESLRKLLIGKFPSASIWEIETNYRKGKSDFRKIKIMIRNLDDLDSVVLDERED
jgi:hypothetical protein